MLKYIITLAWKCCCCIFHLFPLLEYFKGLKFIHSLNTVKSLGPQKIPVGDSHGEVADEGCLGQGDVELSLLVLVCSVRQAAHHVRGGESEGDERLDVQGVDVRVPSGVILPGNHADSQHILTSKHSCTQAQHSVLECLD